MAVKNYSDFVDYFENLAIQHKFIEHDPDPNNRHVGFFRINPTEYLQGNMKITPQGITLVMMDYMWITKGKQQTGKKKGELMLLVVGPSVNRDFDGDTDTMVKCETVVQDIINRLQKDSKENAAGGLWHRSMDAANDVNVSAVTLPTNNQSIGLQMVIPFYVPFNNCVDVDNWNDL